MYLASLLLCGLGFFAASLQGQEQEAGSTSANATTNDTGPAGVIPQVKGFNASLASSSQHDSSAGWSSVMAPNLAFRFSRFFSTDVSIPVYLYINVDANVGTKLRPVYQYVTKRDALGDTALAGHFETHADLLDYNATATAGLPTGNTNYGLGAGQVTYNINNHFEHSFGPFSPDVELGIGDSSALSGSRARKAYVAVGTLAFFQAGTSVELPHKINFDAEAYEQLPIASTTIYSTTGKGKKKVTTAHNEGAAEDNGFNTSLDIPLNGHVTLSGFYSRSLRNKLDTAGFSLTFLLRALPKTEAAK